MSERGDGAVATRSASLRILYLATSYPPDTTGGIPVSTARIAESLAARGHDVHVLVVRGSKANRDETVKGVSVHHRRQTRVPGLRRLLATRPGRVLARPFAFSDPIDREVNDVGARVMRGYSFYREARRLGIAFDVVEAPEADAVALGFALARWRPLVINLRCPPVTTYWRLHGLEPPRMRATLGAYLEYLPIKQAALVTSPSSVIEHGLRDEGRLGRNEVRVIPHPADREPWTSVPAADSTGAVILAVGRLDAVKAPEVLVRAVEQIMHNIPDVEVVFVGASCGDHEGEPYGEWVARTARDLGVKCRFVDHLPREELPQWYAMARVVAIASQWETFSNVALEAMAAGRPVVITSTAGPCDLVERARAGTVVARDDPAALARALECYLREPEEAAAAGRRGREFVVNELAPEANSARREAAYRDAITSMRSRQSPGSRATVRAAHRTPRHRRSRPGSAEGGTDHCAG